MYKYVQHLNPTRKQIAMKSRRVYGNGKIIEQGLNNINLFKIQLEISNEMADL